MNINKFETRSQMLLAIKNIDHAKVFNVSKYGDVLIDSFIRGTKLLIEIKAAGTKGKKMQKPVSISQIMEAGLQLSKNSTKVDEKIVYCSSISTKLKSSLSGKSIFETSDIFLDFNKGIRCKEINDKGKNYDVKYDEMFLCIYTIDNKKTYLKIIQELKREIETEFLIHVGKMNDHFFDLLEFLLLQDWESGIVLDKTNIKILNKKIERISINEIIIFSKKLGNLWMLGDEGKIEDEIKELNSDDFDIIGYREKDMDDSDFIEIIKKNYDNDWSKEKKVLLCFLSQKEKNGNNN